MRSKVLTFCEIAFGCETGLEGGEDDAEGVRDRLGGDGDLKPRIAANARESEEG